MSEFMHTQLLAGAIEIAVNQALAKGKADTEKLTKLNGKSLAVVLAEFNRPLVLTCCDRKLLVTSPTKQELQADCIIQTSVKSLIQLKSEHSLTQLIKTEQLDIEGDIKIAQLYAACFESLSIDWHSELELHLGDIATYKLIQLFNTVSAKLQFAKQQITSDASEWLIHEKRLAASKQEISRFASQVDQLTEQTHAVSDTINQLESRIQSLLNLSGH